MDQLWNFSSFHKLLRLCMFPSNYGTIILLWPKLSFTFNITMCRSTSDKKSNGDIKRDSFMSFPFFFFPSLKYTDIIPHIKEFYWTMEASWSHKALLSDLLLNHSNVYSHFSSLTLCLKQGVKNRNKRVELRGLTFRELTFIWTIEDKTPCFPAAVTR